MNVVAGEDIKRFAELKVGDKVSAKYYENLVIRFKQPGEPDVDTGAKGTTGSDQALPGGTKAKQRTITATITNINTTTPSITFTGPNGWKYESRVQDPAVLDQGEGRRQGRHRLDGRVTGVGRALTSSEEKARLQG